MKIGFDLGSCVLGPAGGIAVFLQAILEKLVFLHPETEYHVFGTELNFRLLQLPANVPVHRLPANDQERITALDRQACALGLDVLFRNYPALGRWQFPLSRQVFFIPDLQHEYYPEFFAGDILRQRRLDFNQALTCAAAIGTLSHHARNSILEQNNNLCPDIFLMPPGPPVGGWTDTAQAVPPSPTGRYFFYPANLWPHKNHARVCAAFARFLQESQLPYELVLSGHPDGWPALAKEWRGLPIRHVGFVAQAEYRQLMQGARALVFFSLYEGFGMPLLEAFAAGTPVLCSNTTSLPEVGGDAVLTCDPTDVAEMSRLMMRIAREDSLGGELNARGRQRLSLFSWEKSAHALHDALQRVGTSSPRIHVQSPPLVSIVTPSLNQGPFLRRTIDSVLSQDYPHIEFLVMDGGSSDESLEILKSYGQRFSWVSEPDEGQSDAINKGFARSRGDIRAYLNSDDVFCPGAVARAVAYFQRHPDWDLLYGRALYIDIDDRITGFYNTADYSFHRLMQDCCICQPAAFWRTRSGVGPFNPHLHLVMDYDYWIRMDRAGRQLVHVPDILAAWRWYPQTKTASRRKQVYRELFATCLREAGWVSYSHFLAYWHYLCFEDKADWPRHWRWLGNFPDVMAVLHYKWYHQQRPWPFVRDVARGLLRRLGRKLGLGRRGDFEKVKGRKGEKVKR